jgi:hypothetical protein
VLRKAAGDLGGDDGERLSGGIEKMHEFAYFSFDV